MKNSLGLFIFCGGCADLYLSQQISVKKKHFYQELRDLGVFLFCFFYSNLGLPSAKSLQNERLVSCPVGEKSSR